jgi:hypothetical protein
MDRFRRRLRPANIRAPVLLLNGEHDLVLLPYATAMKNAISGARLEIVEERATSCRWPIQRRRIRPWWRSCGNRLIFSLSEVRPQPSERPIAQRHIDVVLNWSDEVHASRLASVRIEVVERDLPLG